MKAKVRNVIRPHTNRERAWKVMRAMITFTVTDIAITADVPVENIRHYVQCLACAGYLRKEGKKSIPGRGGFDVIYRLIKNTGPKPPVQKALRFLYDPNTGEYWAENPEMAAFMAEPLVNAPQPTVLPHVKGSIKKFVPLLCPRMKKEGSSNVA